MDFPPISGGRDDKFSGADWFSKFDFFCRGAAGGASFTFDDKPTNADNAAADRADMTAVLDHPPVLSGGRSGVLEFEVDCLAQTFHARRADNCGCEKCGLATDGRQRS